MEQMVCYCFHYSEQDIVDDYKDHGTSTILAKIKDAKIGSACRCEQTHPEKR